MSWRKTAGVVWAKRMFPLGVSLALAVFTSVAPPRPASAEGECGIDPEFQGLQAALGPEVSGDCTAEPAIDDIGRALQRTTTGVFVRDRGPDGPTFTDGLRTWTL